MKSLLVIGMQVGYFAGEPPHGDAEGTVSRINSLAQVVREDGIVVLRKCSETP